jgi:YVTN family beta-propeller protein
VHRWIAPGLSSVFLLIAASALAQGPPAFITFESGQVRPLAMSPDGTQLFAVNTPDNRLEILDVGVAGDLTHVGSVPVGMEPVAVAAHTNDEVWVVNKLSDSVSVVDLTGVPRVVRTLLVGDEPNDIVFAGASGHRAFITTAHRGQNSPWPRSEYGAPGVGRADVWVFNASDLGTSLGGDPLTVLTFFSDKPRALAVADDGATVYAAGFHTGNQTTALNEGLVCDTDQQSIDDNEVETSCSVSNATMPGGLPKPHANHEGIVRPESGLIVKFNRDGGTSGQWQDELGRNWNDAVNFDLPDNDVFRIDAVGDPVPVAVGSGVFSGVGTVLFNMLENASTNAIYVSNTDAQNQVRFEGPGTKVTTDGDKPVGEPPTVQGHLAEARITVISGANVKPRHLNLHIDYGDRPAPAGIKDHSLATPLQMVLSPDDATLYVAAFGSSRIGVISTADLENDALWDGVDVDFDPTTESANYIGVSGGGPTGLVLDGDRLYVMTRFDNSVKVIDLNTNAEVQAVGLHNPEPPEVVAGRPFLYDAFSTSSNGEASCSSCHIFGDMDDLAWDLGNPDDDQKPNDNPFNPVIPPAFDPLPRVFHPMKGPMTTQSLRGLVNMGPQHWRGDREGDAEFSFNAFNVAFPGLLGRAGELTTGEMQAFTDFALRVTYPPNPIRQLDNSLRADEDAGHTFYTTVVSDTVATCEGCHTLEPENGFFGGDGQSTFDAEPQHFKVPHLRNLYQKIGMFGMPNVGGNFDNQFTPGFRHQGDQIRGFGMTHDGSVDTLFRFTSASVFATNDTQRAQLEAFLVAFDSDLAPIVGQQVTRTHTNASVADPRIDLLIDRADATFRSKILGDSPVKECDLIAKTVDLVDGVPVGYRYLGGGVETGLFRPDNGGPDIDDTALRGLAGTAGQEVTYTCAPPGSGERMGVDRDRDDLGDGVETNTGTFGSATDTGTDPTLFDTDGDGYGDGAEVAAGSDPTNRFSIPLAPGVPAMPPWGFAVLVSFFVAVAARAPAVRSRAR